MKDFVVDVLKTVAMCYGIFCFIDKLSYNRAKQMMKEERVSND